MNNSETSGNKILSNKISSNEISPCIHHLLETQVENLNLRARLNLKTFENLILRAGLKLKTFENLILSPPPSGKNQPPSEKNPPPRKAASKVENLILAVKLGFQFENF